MIEFTGITQVVLIDGYGRKYETFNATQIRIMNDLGIMLIQHDGDTRHSTQQVDHE